jgi:hypothetical protein
MASDTSEHTAVSHMELCVLSHTLVVQNTINIHVEMKERILSTMSPVLLRQDLLGSGDMGQEREHAFGSG